MDQLVVTQAVGRGTCSTLAQTRRLGGGWWSVRPAGRAGLYRVSLFASGDNAGDMVADLLWRTPDAGEDVPSVRECGG
jgi:hypothetical protein